MDDPVAPAPSAPLAGLEGLYTGAVTADVAVLVLAIHKCAPAGGSQVRLQSSGLLLCMKCARASVGALKIASMIF
jgi:hypothetical protein